MSLARGRGLCRMCGERYAGLESVDIFEERGAKPAYSDLLRELLGLNPYRGDMKPDRLGTPCAKLLDEWERFRHKCAEAQKILAKRCLASQQQKVSNGPVASSSGLNQPHSSSEEAGSSSGSPAKSAACTLKRPLSSDSDDTDEEDTVRPNTRSHARLRRS